MARVKKTIGYVIAVPVLLVVFLVSVAGRLLLGLLRLGIALGLLLAVIAAAAGVGYLIFGKLGALIAAVLVGAPLVFSVLGRPQMDA